MNLPKQCSLLVLILLASILVVAMCQQRGARKKRELEIMEFDPELGKELNAAYWKENSAEAIYKRMNLLCQSGWPTVTNKNHRARNVILFIGDGMGVTTVTAIRKFKSEGINQPFYKTQLSWDSFPFSGFSKTYELDNFVADSAGTATAYLAGVKTRMGYIGVDATADPKCENQQGYVESIASWATRAGKAAGVVTTTAITHASPSPLYAHLPAPLRNYEYLSTKKNKFSETHPKCVDIALQFVQNAQHLKVAMGGGAGYFTPDTQITPFGNQAGARTDNRSLIQEWKDDRSKGGKKAVYVDNLQDLQKVNAASTDYLLGLFDYGSLTFFDNKPPAAQPTLAQMTEAAINVLSTNPNGYFLFVEGGRIDHGHHDGVARHALTEGVQLDLAVQKALSMVNLDETLIVITADHSHTMSMGGYMKLETSVLGLSAELGTDNKTYTSLMYANGKGALKTLVGGSSPLEGTRVNVSEQEAMSNGYLQQATIPLVSESHGGEDVAVYAVGPHAELFSGVFEQSYIAWAMACAAGMYGPPGVMADRMEAMCPLPYPRVTSSAPTNSLSQMSPVFTLVILFSTLLS